MEWEIFEHWPASAQENMQRDETLLQELAHRTKPILHFYAWKRPSLTFGYFINPENVFDMLEAKKRGIDFARRPTGGGVVFHLWDLAFSVLIPSKSSLYSSNTLDNYQLINRVVQNVAEEWIGRSLELIAEDAPSMAKECTHFCMARPTKYDVILGGKKIAGAAQRKTKDGFLHQGTVALLKPDEDVLTALLPFPEVRAAMLEHTFPLLGKNQDLEQSRNRLKELLKQHFIKL